LRKVKSLGKVRIGGGVSRQGKQLGPAETLPTYRAQIDGISKMMIQEIMAKQLQYYWRYWADCLGKCVVALQHSGQLAQPTYLSTWLVRRADLAHGRIVKPAPLFGDTGSHDILMVRRDLALHNGAKASIFS